MRRLALIGLDCVDPALLEELLPCLPTLSELAAGGTLSRLRSVDPPITIPAWMCMMTGKDPGELGVYGFRNRADRSYTGLRVASSASFSAPAIWDTLGEKGLCSVLIGVPGTYPARPVNGLLVSDFLSPGMDSDFAYPASLRERVRSLVGEYPFDVRDFRKKGKGQVLEEACTMTRKRVELARALLADEKWDLFAMVEIAPDRVHHALWADHDPLHPRHNPRGPFRDALRAYYQLLDKELASLLSDLPSGTQVLIVSDHGAQPLRGGIALNEWLLRKGYLALKEEPAPGARIEELIKQGKVDWPRTLAWGEGGYYGRVFLNVAGREPEGAIPAERYEAVREEIAAGLEAIPDADGRPIGTRVLRPEDLYREVTGIPPDLLVYFGDLSYRSIGSLGHGAVQTRGNDTGADEANHAPYGIFLAHPAVEGTRDRSLLEMRGLVLRHFGLGEAGPLPAYSPDEEKAVEEHLRSLGYVD